MAHLCFAVLYPISFGFSHILHPPPPSLANAAETRFVYLDLGVVSKSAAGQPRVLNQLLSTFSSIHQFLPPQHTHPISYFQHCALSSISERTIPRWHHTMHRLYFPYFAEWENPFYESTCFCTHAKSNCALRIQTICNVKKFSGLNFQKLSVSELIFDAGCNSLLSYFGSSTLYTVKSLAGSLNRTSVASRLESPSKP